MLGDKATLILQQAATLTQSLISASLFSAAPDNSAGLFIKGGTLFFSVLYHAVIALSKVTDSFTGRPILAKHRALALYKPSAVVIAEIASDFPSLLFQVTHFGIIMYFMVGLRTSAEAFFTYWLTCFVSAMSMTALSRFIGTAFPTFDAASKVSGLVLLAFFGYMGYMIAKPDMHPWPSRISWINPMAYGFEALLGNEFHGQDIPNLIPNGPGYLPGEGGQACAGVSGARVGASSLTVDEYLWSMEFSHDHVWRNVGIICAWWVLFVALTIFFTSKWKFTGDGGRSLLIPREKASKTKHVLQLADGETTQVEKQSHQPGLQSPNANPGTGPDLISNKSVYTWRNLTYTVRTPDGDRVLLDNVQGYAKPGMLSALMGSSGTGKKQRSSIC